MDPKVQTALLLTSMGAMGTALGAFMVVLHPKMEFKRLGLFQGLAAGLMLSISVFDLFQESAEAVGTGWANVWFFAGVAFFAAVVWLIPEPDASQLVIDDDDGAEIVKPQKSRKAKVSKPAPSGGHEDTAELLSTPRRASARLRCDFHRMEGGEHMLLHGCMHGRVGHGGDRMQCIKVGTPTITKHILICVIDMVK